MHDNRHFRRGRGKPTFTCAICERLTRDTGQGVDHLCHECYDICGIDNRINDDGNSAETRAKYADESDRLLAKIVKLGGNGERVKKQNSFVWPGK
jgi:hypothetical protein